MLVASKMDAENLVKHGFYYKNKFIGILVYLFGFK